MIEELKKKEWKDVKLGTVVLESLVFCVKRLREEDTPPVLWTMKLLK